MHDIAAYKEQFVIQSSKTICVNFFLLSAWIGRLIVIVQEIRLKCFGAGNNQ